jgi:hypothetical protein
MAKKQLKKMKRGGRKAAKKASSKLRKRGPLAGAVATISGIATSILASTQLRNLINDIIDSAVHRAADAWNRHTERRHEMADGASEGEEAHA